jgi:hypothetical protein
MLRRSLFKYLLALSTATFISPEKLFAVKDNILNELVSVSIETTFELEQTFGFPVEYEEPKPPITTVRIEYKNGSVYEFVGNVKRWMLNKEISKENRVTDIELFDDCIVIHTNNGKCFIGLLKNDEYNSAINNLNGIGYNGSIPWHNKNDPQFFKL